MKPWGCQVNLLHGLPFFLLPGNRERLAGVQGGGNEPPWSPHEAATSAARMPDRLATRPRRFGDALDYASCGTVLGEVCAGPVISIRRVAHSFGHPPVTES